MHLYRIVKALKCVRPQYLFSRQTRLPPTSALRRALVTTTDCYNKAVMDQNTECLIAVGQMCCTGNREENWQQLETIVLEAVQQGAKVVFLPEGSDYIASSRQESLDMAEDLTGPYVTRLRKLAQKKEVWLSAGGLHIKTPSSTRISNTHLLIDPRGDVRGQYAKSHLFATTVPGATMDEGQYVAPGREICPPVSTPAGNIGLAICYDVRFPELSQSLRLLGAHILTFPSAFTLRTGQAHWETLLRARAIETQCYVVAAAQSGQHNDKRASYGHSMIVDPWGRVLCDLTCDNVGVASVNLGQLCDIRRQMPCVQHSRQDLAALDIRGVSTAVPSLLHLTPPPPRSTLLQFGGVTVPGNAVILHSNEAYAFSNLYPRLPGHSLISPCKVVSRVVDLSAGELSALGQLCVLLHRALCRAHQVSYCELALQDGGRSGQTVQHVHIHLLPHYGGSEASVLAPDVPIESQFTDEGVVGPEVPSEESKFTDAMLGSRADKEAAMVAHCSDVRAVLTAEVLHGAEEASLYVPQPFELQPVVGRGGVGDESGIVIRCDALGGDIKRDDVSGDDVPEDAVCLRGQHVVAYCVAGHWQRCHLIVQLTRKVSTLSDVRPHESYELFAALHRLQCALSDCWSDLDTTFIMANKGNGFESLHIHMLPWLVAREPSDYVYPFVAEYERRVGTNECTMGLAVRDALQGDRSPLSELLRKGV